MTPSGRKCFVVAPSAGEFLEIYSRAIAPAVQELNYIPQRIEETPSRGKTILEQVIERLHEADLVIADLSKANATIYLELGFSLMLGKPVVFLAQNGADIPADLLNGRPALLYDYSPEGMTRLKHSLQQAISKLEKQGVAPRPLVDLLPPPTGRSREDTAEFRQQILRLQTALKQREREIDSLRHLRDVQNPEASSIAAIVIDELRGYLDHLTDDVSEKTRLELTPIYAELERLRVENDTLKSDQSELHRLKNMTLVKPHWAGRNFEIDENLCFLLMPFSEPWSDAVWALLQGIITQCGFNCGRADELESRVIMDDIWEGICRARVVIADLTRKNPNVTYEVGLADVLGKEIILLSQTPNDVPFDFLGLRLIPYENSIEGGNRLAVELARKLNKLRGP